jgi:hypothetical protein
MIKIIISHNNMNHSSVKPQLVMVNNIASHNNMKLVAGYIVDHYCLMFDRRVVHIVVAGYIVAHYRLRFHRGVVHIQYSQPQQYEPPLCET